MATNVFLRAVVAVIVLAALQGCSKEPFHFTLADFLQAKTLPYDSPPQVIYRIDDHRFVTLENYRDCNHGETFYNDTFAGIRRKLGRGDVENYQGYLVNADPTGKNLVFPRATTPNLATNDRGVSVYLLYSTDGGKSFGSLKYMDHSFDPFEDSKEYSIVATEKDLYVTRKYKYRSDLPDYDLMVDKYEFDPAHPLSLPSDGAWASKKKLIPASVRSPSDRDRISCDPSVKPTNPDAPLRP